jgi:hypothetical protein
MHQKPAIVLISIAAVAFGACTTPAAAPSAPTATQVARATLTPTAVPDLSASPAASASSEATASGGAQPPAGSIDPCSLLTADEASTAIGKKLSAGVSTQLDPDRVCTFKNGTAEVKVILAPPAPDAKTAQDDWDQARSEIPAGIPVTDLTYFDRSAYGSGSAVGVSVSAMFVIKGTSFFDFYCGFPACSQDASVAAAQLIAGRLP